MLFTIRPPQKPQELAEGLKLRRQIFVEEQEIPLELDDDGKDAYSTHLIAVDEQNQIAGYGRLSPEGGLGIVSRIAVRKAYRGHGLGKKIVRALEEAAIEQKLQRLVLSPHIYLEKFYASLGYSTIEGSKGRVGPNELIEMEKMI